MRHKLPVVQASDSSFSALDKRWLSAALELPLPVETRATCDDCAMVSDASSDLSALQVSFDPETKCCTIVPYLDNFRVGAILASDAPGRQVIEARIEARAGVLPLGVAQSHAEREADEQMRKAGLFGRSKDHRRPYYIDDGGRCGIWQYRSSACATYHCRYVRGVIGATVWRTLQDLLGAVERTLARWCLLEADFDVDALAVLFPSKPGPIPGTALRDPHSDGLYDAVWGSWQGREAQWFAACAERVADLSWQDVLQIGGPEIGILARTLRRAVAAWHDPTIPERMRPRPHNADSASPLMLRVRAYSSTDTIELPMQVMASVPLFDGRPTAEVLADARQMLGTEIDDDTLRALYEFRVLGPA